MKRQLRQRLRLETNVQLAESNIFTADQSFIYELSDLLDKEKQPNEHKYLTTVKPLTTLKNPLHSTGSFSAFRHYHSKNDILKEHNAETVFHQHRSRNKMDHNRNYEQLNDQRSLLMTKLFENDEKERRKSIKDPPFLESKKQGENNSLRYKFDYNRSSIVKVKEILYKNVLEKCQNCHEIKSEVFRNNLVCRNRKCRLLHYYQDFQTFPLSAILYDIEMPSSTIEDLDQLIKKIKDEIIRIEEWRNSLMELQFEVNSIIQGRKQYQRHNKNELRVLTTSLMDLKSKRVKNENQFSSIRNQLQKIELRQPYEEFNRWKKIDFQKFNHTKTIADSIMKCKPLCLKVINSEIAQSMADISDNFTSLKVCLNASQFLSYNFLGNLNKIALTIDGSIQLKRDNFIMVQDLEELKLIFNSRKTSRELRELFNILPNSDSLIFDFDFKLNSHLSSETFPLITSAFSLANKAIKISLHNARPQIFEDLSEASRIVNKKQNMELKIQMNPYIPEAQWPQVTKSKEWGTRIVKNLVHNMGNKAIKIVFNLPLSINSQQVSQMIINADYCYLAELKIVSNNCKEDAKKGLEKLLQKMTNRKKLLLAHLLNQKRQSSHPLNKSRRLAQSVYQALF